MTLTTRDATFLRWIADRLVFVYHERELTDFVQRLRAIADEIDQQAHA